MELFLGRLAKTVAKISNMDNLHSELQEEESVRIASVPMNLPSPPGPTCLPSSSVPAEDDTTVRTTQGLLSLGSAERRLSAASTTAGNGYASAGESRPVAAAAPPPTFNPSAIVVTPPSPSRSHGTPSPARAEGGYGGMYGGGRGALSDADLTLMRDLEAAGIEVDMTGMLSSQQQPAAPLLPAQYVSSGARSAPTAGSSVSFPEAGSIQRSQSRRTAAAESVNSSSSSVSAAGGATAPYGGIMAAPPHSALDTTTAPPDPTSTSTSSQEVAAALLPAAAVSFFSSAALVAAGAASSAAFAASALGASASSSAAYLLPSDRGTGMQGGGGGAIAAVPGSLRRVAASLMSSASGQWGSPGAPQSGPTASGPLSFSSTAADRRVGAALAEGASSLPSLDELGRSRDAPSGKVQKMSHSGNNAGNPALLAGAQRGGAFAWLSDAWGALQPSTVLQPAAQWYGDVRSRAMCALTPVVWLIRLLSVALGTLFSCLKLEGLARAVRALPRRLSDEQLAGLFLVVSMLYLAWAWGWFSLSSGMALGQLQRQQAVQLAAPVGVVAAPPG